MKYRFDDEFKVQYFGGDVYRIIVSKSGEDYCACGSKDVESFFNKWRVFMHFFSHTITE
jgi:hypothetical protein